jgi:outer membrane protein insertion porin family
MKYLRLFIFIFLFVIFSNKSFSDIINKITISGNVRITDETIITFLPVKLNDDIDENQINNITKELYETNFFKNVIITFNNNELNIKVEENPIIQNITFNGIKSDSLKQFITSETILKPRSSFTDFFLEQDLNKMKDNLSKRGYYFSSITQKLRH